MRIFFLYLLICITVLTACKKEEDESEIIRFEGFKLTDALGNSIGEVGNASDDWQVRNWSELSAKEQGFLNFSDNVNLDGTAVSTVYSPLAFPNPMQYQSSIQFRTDDSVKVKFALVDSTGKVWKTGSEKFKGAKVFYQDVSDPVSFPSKMSLRYYYSFSAASQPNFKAGYGDIKICRSNSPQWMQECY